MSARAFATVVLGVLGMWPLAAAAESPADVSEPHEAVEPPPCGELTAVGCCAGWNVRWCRNGTPVEYHCAFDVPDGSCGWDAETGRYACGFTGVDPSGAHPYACPGKTCAPDCQDRVCGSDGCGGSCGTCGTGEHCHLETILGTARAAAKCGPVPGCGVIPPVGCCDYYGEDDARSCVDGVQRRTTCARNDPPDDTCGWSAAHGDYRCGGSGDDPSGLNPRVCPWWGPEEIATGAEEAGDDVVEGSYAEAANDGADWGSPLPDPDVPAGGDPQAPSGHSGAACAATPTGSSVAALLLLAMVAASRPLLKGVTAQRRAGRRRFVRSPGTP
jgi:hypothetical protein